MPLADDIHRLIVLAPTAMILCVAVGACFLWRRTKRVSVLAQFIASVLIFAGFALEQIRWLTITPYRQSVFADVMRSEPMLTSIQLADLIGLVAFSISYLCYALRQKRI